MQQQTEGRRSARLAEVSAAAGAAPQQPRRRTAAGAERRARAAERQAEVEDPPWVLLDKCRLLARAIRDAKHLVVYTGAGISTAADIPDYRGPRGVWTALRRGDPLPAAEVCGARPTLTHMAVRALWARGLARFVVSQNCDGLHVRSGLPRRALAELHGDAFLEACARCRRVLARDFDAAWRSARHRHLTRRVCACGAALRDTVVHFGERGRLRWPLNWRGALRHAARADVVLVLGSSLRVLRRYPRLWRMAAPQHRRPKLYIVNLQWTPKDAVAELKINARTDLVMEEVTRLLRVPVAAYSARRDPLLAHATPLAPAERHTAPPARLAAPSSSEDSDDDTPLGQLRARLRPPPAPAPPAPAPDLRRFQVQLRDRAASILLRRRRRSPDENASPRRAPHPPAAAAPPADDKPLAEDVKPPADFKPLDDVKPPDDKALADVKFEENKVGRAEREDKRAARDARAELAACERAARRHILRAARLCRARFYPGLHTALEPPRPRPAQCGWCWARHGAARCLWYPRQRRRARRACTCCPRAAPPAAAAAAAPDAPGWFGKGHRKGMRKRR